MRALFVSGGVSSIWQFVNYYVSEGCADTFDVLIHDYGSADVVASIKSQCKHLDIFNRIISEKNLSLINSSLATKVKLFTKTVINSLLGRSKEFAKALIEKELGEEFNYDYVVLYSDRAFISGCLMQLCDRVILLEEGMNDYLPRYTVCPRKYLFSVFELSCMIIARLGFGSVSQSCVFNYELSETKHCIKYASVPGLLKYREYKEIRSFHLSHSERVRSSDLMNRIYPLEDTGCGQVRGTSVLLLSTPLSIYIDSEQVEKYNAQIVEIIDEDLLSCSINEAFKILLKRHPYDLSKYERGNVELQELPKDIPAEVIIDVLRPDMVYLMSPSSVLLHLLGSRVPYRIIASRSYPEDLLEVFNQFETLIKGKMIWF